MVLYIQLEKAYTYRAQVHNFLLGNKFLSKKLKLWVCYISIFHHMINLKLCKMLFHLKSIFRSQDIQILHKKRMIEKPLKVKFFLCTQSLFMDKIMKKKGAGTNYQSLFMLQNMLRKIPFQVTYHLGNFDDLTQGSF